MMSDETFSDKVRDEVLMQEVALRSLSSKKTGSVSGLKGQFTILVKDMESFNASRKWTQLELQRFDEGTKIYGLDWNQVAWYVNTKTAKECKQLAMKLQWRETDKHGDLVI